MKLCEFKLVNESVLHGITFSAVKSVCLIQSDSDSSSAAMLEMKLSSQSCSNVIGQKHKQRAEILSCDSRFDIFRYKMCFFLSERKEGDRKMRHRD